MKKIFILLLLASLATQATVTIISEKELGKISGRTFLASPMDAEHWFFEFKNKTKEPLFLTIICEESSNYSVIDDIKISASTGSSEKNHGYLRLTERPFKPLIDAPRAGEGRCYLLINNEKNTFVKAWRLSPTQIKGTQTHWETCRIYLTYEKGTLRIQEGTSTGIVSSAKKTQSGLEISGWAAPTITSVDPDSVIKKLTDIEKKMPKK